MGIMTNPELFNRITGDLAATPAAKSLYMYLWAYASRSGDFERAYYATHAPKIAAFVKVQSIGGSEAEILIVPELVRLGWVEKVEFQGEVGYVMGRVTSDGISWLAMEHQNAASLSAKLRQQAKIQQAQINKAPPEVIPATRPSIALASDEELSSWMPIDELSKFAYRHFVSVYERVNGTSAYFIENNVKEKKHIKLILGNHGKCLARTKRYLSFIIENWPQLKTVYQFYGEPFPSLLSQSWVQNIISEAQETGIRPLRKPKTDVDGLGDRAGKTDWGNETHGW